MMDTMQQMLLLFAGLLKIQSLCSGRPRRNECFSAAFSFFIHLPLGCWVTDMGNTQSGLSLEGSRAPLRWITCGARATRPPYLTALTYFLMIVIPVREQESSAQILPPTSGMYRLTETKHPSKTRQLILRFKKMRAQERQAWAVCFRHSLGKLFSIVCLPLWFCLFYSWIIVVWYYYDGSPYKGLSGTGVRPPLQWCMIMQIKKITHIVVVKKYLYIEDQTNKEEKPTPPRLQWKKNHWLCQCQQTIIFPIILAIWPIGHMSCPSLKTGTHSVTQINLFWYNCQICMMSVLALFACRLDKNCRLAKNCLADKASIDF